VKKHIYLLFDTWVDLGLKFLRTKCRENIPSVNINIVTSLCFCYQALLQPTRGIVVEGPISEDGDLNDDVIATLNRVFAWSYVWSIGGNIDHKSIEGFDVFIRTELERVTAFPGSDTVYEYYVNVKDKVKF
jgi:dynein heavy chain